MGASFGALYITPRSIARAHGALLPGQCAVAGVEFGDGGVQVVGVAVVDHDVVGEGQALGAGGLCGDHPVGQRGVYPVALHQA